MKELIPPFGLGIIMLSLGLSLTINDFRRALLYPKAVLVALVCQVLIMPTICFLMAKGLGLAPELAVGLMLLAATPGGTTANLYSYLAGGDVALNITLTAVNSLLSLVTLPLIVSFSLKYFLGANQAIPMQSEKVVQGLMIVVLPPLIGMYLRYISPSMAQRMDEPVKVFSTAFLFFIAATLVYRQWYELIDYFPLVGGAVMLFTALSLIAGYAVALWVRLERKQAIAIGMEIGVHNAALASGLALSPLLLNNSTMAVPPVMSGIVSVFTAGMFVVYINRQSQKNKL